MTRTTPFRAATTLAAAGYIVVGAASPAAALARPKKEPKAEARSCPEVGEGYVRLPGSDTCVRVGGSVRVEGVVIGR